MRVLRVRAEEPGRRRPGQEGWIIESRPMTAWVKSAARTRGIKSAIGASHGTDAYSARISSRSDWNWRAGSGATRRTTGSARPTKSRR
ncbi:MULTISPECIES: hypothetical protein [unclassified Streptomyces]|uniref:hypothetical protein n=1 Tax=unclassified Streptomyces TaxID=2593676 RepID=UPI000ABD7E59|nr:MULTISPECIES: hypothetical protein [unclassified Streptomyces]